MTAVSLRVTEVFFSLQGESSRIGLPTVFIRLTGCPLRCQYCDTAYAFSGGETLELDAIYAAVAQYPARYVTVTGGEPLAQRQVLELLSGLCERGYQVSLETGGSLDVSMVDTRVMKVMDLKTPGSREERRNLYANLEHLHAHDQIKFVICDRSDYEWARARMDEYALGTHCEVLFSPSSSELAPATLADWILEDGLPVRFQIQLHKHLWGDVAGR